LILSILLNIIVSAPFCSSGEEVAPATQTVAEVDTTGNTNRVINTEPGKTPATADSIHVGRIQPGSRGTRHSHARSVKPSTALYHSLAFPGWGQFNNGKKKKAALFFIAETVCIGGFLYKNYQMKTGDFTDWEKQNLRTDKNTFLLYWMISKVVGIVDAYVDAQLTDFNVNDITPEELKKPEDPKK
jgi:hypothetical protein